jgi:hypothetical protein
MNPVGMHRRRIGVIGIAGALNGVPNMAARLPGQRALRRAEVRMPALGCVAQDLANEPISFVHLCDRHRRTVDLRRGHTNAPGA